MQNSTHIIQEQVLQAVSEKQPLVIAGSNSKRFYGRNTKGERLSTSIHHGILEYEPTELVLRARAGTPLQEIESALQAHGQVLACEPPHFGEQATFGGMIATGLSGPARPYRAAVQDTVLGCTMVNGQGEILRFGGKVMKNVAGYDVSRLMVGSLGCLGVLLDITVKVIPAAGVQQTVIFTIERANATAFINELRRQGLPVTASCQSGPTELRVRFSAGREEIARLPETLATHYGFVPSQSEQDVSFWSRLKEHQLPFFATQSPLWRLSVPPDTDISALGLPDEDVLTEWGGALHWVRTSLGPESLFEFARSASGHACLFRSGTNGNTEAPFQPLTPVLGSWHKRLKEAFDPAGVFNPGRMYEEF